MKKVSKNNMIARIKENSTAMSVGSLVICVLLAGIAAINIFDPLYHHADREKIAASLACSAEILMFSAILAVSYVIFRRISSCGTPFTSENVKSMRLISLLFYINSILPNTVLCIAAGGYHVNNGNDWNTGFINTTMVIAGIVFSLVTEYFNYGTMLQQESDETV